MKYADKLKDPRWQKRRLEILQRDDWHCQKCFDSEETLHVHHKFYSGKDPWDAPDSALVTLCAPCHEEEGESLKAIKNDLVAVLGGAGGFAYNMDELKDAFVSVATSEKKMVDPDWSVISYAINNLLNSFVERGELWIQFENEYFEQLAQRRKGREDQE